MKVKNHVLGEYVSFMLIHFISNPWLQGNLGNKDFFLTEHISIYMYSRVLLLQMEDLLLGKNNNNKNPKKTQRYLPKCSILLDIMFIIISCQLVSFVIISKMLCIWGVCVCVYVSILVS